MKIRSGFVSNSSSSSFVVLKDAISKIQQDQIINYVDWVDYFIELDKTTDIEVSESDNYSSNKLEDRFIYCKDTPWQIIEFEDCIFGETSMDNFSMQDYLDYIKVNEDYVMWDDGWCDDPTQRQKAFIQQIKRTYRKDKLTKINKSNEDR